MDINNYYNIIKRGSGTWTNENASLKAQEIYMPPPSRRRADIILQNKTFDQDLDTREQIQTYGIKQVTTDSRYDNQRNKRNKERIYENVNAKVYALKNDLNEYDERINIAKNGANRKINEDFNTRLENRPTDIGKNESLQYENGKSLGNDRKLYDNFPSSINEHDDVPKEDYHVPVSGDIYLSRRRRKTSNKKEDKSETSNHSSKAWLPKIYSDDTDLLNPTPMAGGDQNEERLYDTIPLVAKKSMRPSIQDLERSMMSGGFDIKDQGIYNTVDELGENGPNIEGDKHEKYERHKTDRRRRKGRRGDAEYMKAGSDDIDREDYNEQNVDTIIQGQDENRSRSDWDQANQRPNELVLYSNNQDLLKQPENHQTDHQEYQEYQGNDFRNESRESSSSTASYCSIESPATQTWNRPTSTPDSTSSSPIIWNFSHFYIGRKV